MNKVFIFKPYFKRKWQQYSKVFLIRASNIFVLILVGFSFRLFWLSQIYLLAFIESQKSVFPSSLPEYSPWVFTLTISKTLTHTQITVWIKSCRINRRIVATAVTKTTTIMTATTQQLFIFLTDIMIKVTKYHFRSKEIKNL